MAEERYTPEERLLDIIESGDSKDIRFKQKRAQFKLFSGLPKIFAPVRSVFTLPFDLFRKFLKEPNLKVINRIFFVVAFSLILFSVYEFFFKRPDIDLVFEAARKSSNILEIKRPDVDPRPYLHFLEMVRRRNIFSPIEIKQEIKKEKPKKKSLAELTKDLSLVGVSWSNRPLAMIEDTVTKKTYFLKQGDMIKQFTIKTITQDTVILTFDGQDLELR